MTTSKKHTKTTADHLTDFLYSAELLRYNQDANSVLSTIEIPIKPSAAAPLEQTLHRIIYNMLNEPGYFESTDSPFNNRREEGFSFEEYLKNKNHSLQPIHIIIEQKEELRYQNSQTTVRLFFNKANPKNALEDMMDYLSREEVHAELDEKPDNFTEAKIHEQNRKALCRIIDWNNFPKIDPVLPLRKIVNDFRAEYHQRLRPDPVIAKEDDHYGDLFDSELDGDFYEPGLDEINLDDIDGAYLDHHTAPDTLTIPIMTGRTSDGSNKAAENIAAILTKVIKFYQGTENVISNTQFQAEGDEVRITSPDLDRVLNHLSEQLNDPQFVTKLQNSIYGNLLSSLAAGTGTVVQR